MSSSCIALLIRTWRKCCAGKEARYISNSWDSMDRTFMNTQKQCDVKFDKILIRIFFLHIKIYININI